MIKLCNSWHSKIVTRCNRCIHRTSKPDYSITILSTYVYYFLKKQNRKVGMLVPLGGGMNVNVPDTPPEGLED